MSRDLWNNSTVKQEQKVVLDKAVPNRTVVDSIQPNVNSR